MKRFEGAKLEVLQKEDSWQTHPELVDSLVVTRAVIYYHLKCLGMNQKQHIVCRTSWSYKIWNVVFHMRKAPPMTKKGNFFYCVLAGDAVYLAGPARCRILSTFAPKWNHLRSSIIRLSRALKEKRPQYEKGHDKVILLHENARPHTIVKTYPQSLK